TILDVCELRAWNQLDAGGEFPEAAQSRILKQLLLFGVVVRAEARLSVKREVSVDVLLLELHQALGKLPLDLGAAAFLRTAELREHLAAPGAHLLTPRIVGRHDRLRRGQMRGEDAELLRELREFLQRFELAESILLGCDLRAVVLEVLQ